MDALGRDMDGLRRRVGAAWAALRGHPECCCVAPDGEAGGGSGNVVSFTPPAGGDPLPDPVESLPLMEPDDVNLCGWGWKYGETGAVLLFVDGTPYALGFQPGSRMERLPDGEMCVVNMQWLGPFRAGAVSESGSPG